MVYWLRVILSIIFIFEHVTIYYIRMHQNNSYRELECTSFTICYMFQNVRGAKILSHLVSLK